MRAPNMAKLSTRTVATITAATRTIAPSDAGLGDVYARAKEQLDEAAREQSAIPGTIEDAAMVVSRAQRRELG